MDSTTTEINSGTGINDIGDDYFPSITLYFGENGRVKYKPVHVEKKLIQYDLSLIQGIYPDGSVGSLYINVKIDSSKNIIRDRFEILDL